MRVEIPSPFLIPSIPSILCEIEGELIFQKGREMNKLGRHEVRCVIVFSGICCARTAMTHSHNSSSKSINHTTELSSSQLGDEELSLISLFPLSRDLIPERKTCHCGEKRREEKKVSQSYTPRLSWITCRSVAAKLRSESRRDMTRVSSER